MDNKWDPFHIGIVLNLHLQGRATRDIIRVLSSMHNTKRSADAVKTVINKAFYSNSDPHCSIKKWNGQGMARRREHECSRREKKRIGQGYNNGMTEYQLSIVTGRSVDEIKEILTKVRPTYAQRGMKGFNFDAS